MASPANPSDDGSSTSSPTSKVIRVAQRGPTSATGEVDRIRAKLRDDMARRARVRANKAKLVKQYQQKLAEIDRLKKQRASWRRDRLIRSRMSQSHGTAKQLSALDQRLRQIGATIRKREKALVAAIDRELAGALSATRARDLRAWKRAANKGPRRSAKKIVLPEDEIDPLADPEELEYQASLLRQSEDQLARELGKLEHQAKRYRHMVSLRKKFSRADELARFDDDRPRRGSGRGADRSGANGAEADTTSLPPPPPSQPPPPSTEPNQTPDPGTDDLGSDSGAENFSSADPMFDVVLADVVDASTIKALRAAGISSDPAVKAKAAERARAQVRARVERLRKRRKLMQKRAKRLRKRP